MRQLVDDQCRVANEIIEAITAKLKANRLVLQSSAHRGRLTWRMTKEGKIEVNLEPKI